MPNKKKTRAIKKDALQKEEEEDPLRHQMYFLQYYGFWFTYIMIYHPRPSTRFLNEDVPLNAVVASSSTNPLAVEVEPDAPVYRRSKRLQNNSSQAPVTKQIVEKAQPVVPKTFTPPADEESPVFKLLAKSIQHKLRFWNHSDKCNCVSENGGPKCTDDTCSFRQRGIECSRDCGEQCKNQMIRNNEIPFCLAIRTETKFEFCVITDEPFAVGSIVVEYVGEMKIGEVYQDQEYAYPLRIYGGQDDFYICTRRIANHARYVKHSNHGNCKFCERLVDEIVRVVLVALRPIAKGEVITASYPQKGKHTKDQYMKITEEQLEEVTRSNLQDQGLLPASNKYTKIVPIEVIDDPNKPFRCIYWPCKKSYETKKGSDEHVARRHQPSIPELVFKPPKPPTTTTTKDASTSSTGPPPEEILSSDEERYMKEYQAAVKKNPFPKEKIEQDMLVYYSKLEGLVFRTIEDKNEECRKKMLRKDKKDQARLEARRLRMEQEIPIDKYVNRHAKAIEAAKQQAKQAKQDTSGASGTTTQQDPCLPGPSGFTHQALQLIRQDLSLPGPSGCNNQASTTTNSTHIDRVYDSDDISD